MKHPILYADLNSRVGKVRTAKCPLCWDGQETKRLMTENKLLRDAVEQARSYLASYNDEKLAALDAHDKEKT